VKGKNILIFLVDVKWAYWWGVTKINNTGTKFEDQANPMLRADNMQN